MNDEDRRRALRSVDAEMLAESLDFEVLMEAFTIAKKIHGERRNGVHLTPHEVDLALIGKSIECMKTIRERTGMKLIECKRMLDIWKGYRKPEHGFLSADVAAYLEEQAEAKRLAEQNLE